jgi:hypothetical protein
MSHIVQITHRPTKKAKVVFEYNVEAKTYTHNETGPMRADLLNTMGKKLSAVDIDYHYSTVAELEVWLYKFVYVPLSATDKASIKSFKRKAITALNKVIKENIEYTEYSRASLAKQETRATLMQPETNDFDFDFEDEPVVDKPAQESLAIPTAIKKDTNDFDFEECNDFNFGADITDEQPTPEPDTKSKDEINLKVDSLFIDCARSVESLCLSIAALCRIAIEQEKEKPSE